MICSTFGCAGQCARQAVNLAMPRPPFDDTSVVSATMACTACGFEYEKRDMTSCPFHHGAICSLCCSLESSCHDMCKPAHGLVPATPEGQL
jgi:hypothetical protein